MSLRNASIFFALAMLLLSGHAAATNCLVLVVRDDGMTINNANIYLDGWSDLIGKTTYSTSIGQHCWVGDIPEGEHTLNARWDGIPRFRPATQGSTEVDIAGTSTMRITIVTHKI